MTTILNDQPHESSDRRSSRELGLGAAIRSLHRAYMRQLQAALAPHRASVAQYIHLRALWEEGGLAQSEISNRLGIEKASSTAVLDTLDRTGLISRVRDESDRRRMRVSLTAEGERHTRRLMTTAKQVAIRAGVNIPPEEQTRFFETLDRMVMNLTEL